MNLLKKQHNVIGIEIIGIEVRREKCTFTELLIVFILQV